MGNESGWIKLHRSTLNNPIVCKDSDHLAIWVYLLMKATHKEHDTIFAGKRLQLKPGQLVTGRSKIASDLRCSESKVQRVLKCYESEHQIEQQTSNQNRLISIINWYKYQNNEQQNEHQLNNDRTTSEHQVNTYKNGKNDKNVRNKKPSVKFDFRKALIEIGVNEQVANDFMVVRKKKNATNTQTAFNRLKNQIDKTDIPPNEIIAYCVERNWQGFQYEWIKDSQFEHEAKRKANQGKKPQPKDLR